MKLKDQLLNSKKAVLLLSCTFCLLNSKLTVSGVEPDAKKCEPKSCGSAFNITYPFWLQDQQPNYCGFPTLNLSCKEGSTLLNFLDREYYINNIFYNNRSFIVVPAEIKDDPCPLPSMNFTADLYSYPLKLSNDTQLVFFVFNCSRILRAEYKSLSCGDFSFFGGVYNKSAAALSEGSGQCRFVEVPTARRSFEGDDDYSAILSEGWPVNWELTDCSDCKESGGTCGFNDTEKRFMCMCGDRVHRVSCKEQKKMKGAIIGVATASGVLLMLVVLFLLYMKKKMTRKSPSTKYLIKNSPTDQFVEKDGEYLKTQLFSYEELEEATNGFESSRELGDGGFGTVYKGQLRDGRVVAIKRLYEHNYRRLEQFMNEVDILSTIRHQNLVDLYGCTSRHSRELLLVYEFVSNGTVADHLHGPRAKERILTWPLRLNIAIETADALAYLHAVNPPIIHRDVKTNNILLDSNFHVKVGDFGLSRLFPNDVTHVSTAPQGTPGYVDPEYHRCYQLTDRSDVYSFGVVLIELISSKPAVDITRQRSEINLSNLAITKIQNSEVDQLVDMSLGYQSDESVRKMITMVAELAFRCLQSDGDMRPPIKEVLQVLKAIQCRDYTTQKNSEEDDGTRDVRLLKSVTPFSPDSVMNNWTSRSTTPNTSG